MSCGGDEAPSTNTQDNAADCAGDLTACDAECVDVSTSASHCGACGVACADGESCAEGECVSSAPECDAPSSLCGDACVDVSTSSEHCGECDNACAEGQSCVEGECTPETEACGDSERDCSGECVDVDTSTEHCGGCDVACATDEVCSAGVCARVCGEEEVDCGECIDPMTDSDYCGATNSCQGDEAGEACGAGRVCAAGVCVEDCAASGLEACQEMCVDTETSTDHCGGCDMPCDDYASASTSCESSECVYTCDEGFGDCNDDLAADGCEQPLDDVSHCGECGVVCAVETNASSSCDGTSCGELVCDQGFLDCDADLGMGGTGCEFEGSRCPRVDWVFTLGTPFPDVPSGNGRDVDIAVDSVGNSYTTVTNGAKHTIGMTDYIFDRAGTLVVALDPMGAQRWVRSFRDTIGMNPFAVGDAIIRRVIVEPNTDDVYLVGDGWGEGLEMDGVPISPVNGGCAAFAIKLNGADGALEWVRSFEDATCSNGFGAAIAPTGLLFGGTFSGTMTLGAQSHTSTEKDMFFAVLDSATGAVNSSGVIAGTGSETLADIVSLPNGDVGIIGAFSTTDTTIGSETLTLQGDRDILLMRASSSGVPTWVKSWGTASVEVGNELRVGPSGAMYASGSYNVSLTVGATTLTGNSFGTWVMRVDPATGVPEWVVGSEGGGNSLFPDRSDIVIDANEVVHLGWYTSAALMGSTFGGQPIISGNFGRHARIDGVTGAVTSIEDFDTVGGTIYFVGMDLDPTGAPIFAGYFNQGAALDGTTFPSAGLDDQFIMRVLY